MKIYTLGYEKRNIQEYVQILLQAEVKILIDVREIAWSYKRDFCKTKFAAALMEAGIKYVHVKELGNPKNLRKAGGTSTQILSNYKTYLRETESGISSLMAVFDKARQHNLNICLTCFERDHACCHRSIITQHILPSISTTKVVHL